MVDIHKMRLVPLAVILVAFLVTRWMRVPTIPDHLLGHKAKYIPELIDIDTADALLELIKEMKEFPSNTQDLSFYNTSYEHIGEAVDIGPNGKCEDAMLVPSKNGKQCVFPGRIDVARHFMKYGGIEGKKERYEVAVSRLQSFGRYVFNPDDFPAVRSLFSNERFIDEARNICPEHKQVVDPFQFNFIIQVPGQSVALHLDAVYFTDASRFQYPMWLLSVMAQSGLYQEKFIDQVQAVGYLHKWNSTKRGGKFTYWKENTLKPLHEEAAPRAGSMIDGSKVIHASTIYYPNRPPPIMDKSSDNRLVYLGDDKWEVTSNGMSIHAYKTDDLRITIVYRARCFESEDTKEKFVNWYQSASIDEVRPVSEILQELKNKFGTPADESDATRAEKKMAGDLSRLLSDAEVMSVELEVEEDVVIGEEDHAVDTYWIDEQPTNESNPVTFSGGMEVSTERDLVEKKGFDHVYLDGLSTYKLGLLLLDEYIKYPLPPSAIIPYNYCMADKLVPSLRPLVNLFC